MKLLSFKWLAVLVATVVLGSASSTKAIDYTQFDAVWDFEGPDNTTRLADKSGNGNHLTFQATGPGFVAPTNGTNSYKPNAVGNSAARFFGDFSSQDVAATNGGFVIPAGAYAGGDYTFVVVLKSTTLNDGSGSGRHKTILDPQGGTGGGVRFQHRPPVDGNPNAWVLDPGGAQNPGITQDNWHILMLTLDTGAGGTGNKIYDNNSSELNPFALETSNTDIGIPSNFFIGTQGGTSDTFHGEIAFAMFHNGLLSTAQQLELLQFLNSAVPEPSSVALWSLVGVSLVGFAAHRQLRKRK